MWITCTRRTIIGGVHIFVLTNCKNNQFPKNELGRTQIYKYSFLPYAYMTPSNWRTFAAVPWCGMVVQYCKTYTGRADGETGITDRTNSTVREDIYGSWIKFFNPWKRKFLAKGSFGKFVNPHGPCELKMASRIVRTVRFVKMVYGSWIKFSNPWKSQFVTRGSLEKFVDPYGSYGPYELKMASGQ